MRLRFWRRDVLAMDFPIYPIVRDHGTSDMLDVTFHVRAKPKSPTDADAQSHLDRTRPQTRMGP